MKLTLKPIAGILSLALLSQTALAMACASSCEMTLKGNSQPSVQSKPEVTMGHHHHGHPATSTDSAKRFLPSINDVAKCASHDASAQIANRLVSRDSIAIVPVVTYGKNSADKALTISTELPDIAVTPPKTFTVLRI